MVDTFRLDLTQDPKVISGSRLFDAPRSLVFEAWTDPKHLAHWWGPNGFSLTTHSFDFRAGGVWRFVMHGPDGRDYENRITFDEIVRARAHRVPPWRRRRRGACAVPYARHLRGRARQNPADDARHLPVGGGARPRHPRVRCRQGPGADARAPRRLPGADGRVRRRARLRGPAQARVAGVDRARTARAVVGTEGRHHPRRQARAAPRRHLPLRDAVSSRVATSGDGSSTARSPRPSGSCSSALSPTPTAG